MLPAQHQVGLASSGYIQRDLAPDRVKVMARSKQEVLQLGHEHSLDKRGTTRDRLPLNDDGLELVQDVVRLVETLVVGGVRRKEGMRLELAAAE